MLRDRLILPRGLLFCINKTKTQNNKYLKKYIFAELPILLSVWMWIYVILRRAEWYWLTVDDEPADSGRQFCVFSGKPETRAVWYSLWVCQSTRYLRTQQHVEMDPFDKWSISNIKIVKYCSGLSTLSRSPPTHPPTHGHHAFADTRFLRFNEYLNIRKRSLIRPTICGDHQENKFNI